MHEEQPLTLTLDKPFDPPWDLSFDYLCSEQSPTGLPLPSGPDCRNQNLRTDFRPSEKNAGGVSRVIRMSQLRRIDGYRRDLYIGG